MGWKGLVCLCDKGREGIKIWRNVLDVMRRERVAGVVGALSCYTEGLWIEVFIKQVLDGYLLIARPARNEDPVLSVAKIRTRLINVRAFVANLKQYLTCNLRIN